MKIQTSQATKPPKLESPDIGHRTAPSDHRELALVQIAEGAALAPREVGQDRPRRVLAHLDRDGAGPGEDPAVRVA